MTQFIPRVRFISSAEATLRLVAAVLAGTLALTFGQAAPAQQATPASAPAASSQPGGQPPGSPETQPSAPAPAESAAAQGGMATETSSPAEEASGGITEDELKQLLVGKELFLRGGYLFDSLSYNEHGALIGGSPHASYTLCGVMIDKVRLTKHKVELEGSRYGLHFLGALPYEDPTKAVDWVKITPKKKLVKITIDREVVIKVKKVKEDKPAKEATGKTGAGVDMAAKAETAAGTQAEAGPGTAAAASTGVAAKAEPPAAAQPQPAAAAEPPAMSDADQLKADIAAAPPSERPVDWQSITTTTSPAHAAKILRQALDHVFASTLDDRMIAAMPAFWKLYYQAVAARTDYRPADPAVLRQNTVDQKARLLSTFEPGSNEYAQAAGVAGMALYHTVIGTNGKPDEIAVARPIGFGLDENAVAAIRNAKFEPAVKDGKPVPVLLDLVVQFRIYSKRTAVMGVPEPADKQDAPVLPGPYSAQHP